MSAIYSTISGSGSYIPKNIIKNKAFLSKEFYGTGAKKLDKDNQEIIDKFLEITTIAERRYASDSYVTSDIAAFAGAAAIENAGIDKETLDHIIVAHNFGDVKSDNNRSDIVPSLAARVKHKLKIENPECVAYDVTFGCPGWLQGVIQADYYIKSGDAKRVLVIGAEILSRVYDPHDRDGMIYSDGAGAVILQAEESDGRSGILAHKTRSDTFMHSKMLFMGCSYNTTEENKDDIYLKMHGRKLYQYALEHVPQAIKSCLEKSDVHLSEIKKVLIHQANGKMDDAILRRLYDLYEIKDIPEGVMPMTISWLGNSSVATLPTLYDLISKNEMENQQFNEGDLILFASVGAGMNINAAVYKV